MKSFKQYLTKSNLILEGKHWPEDYVKTAKNIIKASPLGQQSWYSDQYIDADLKTFANEFQPLSHKNSNLGFFSPVIKWFVEYSGSDKNKYQEFIEGKLDNIIRTLQQILNDKSYDSQREQIKKMSFKDFEKMMSGILTKAAADSDEKMKNIQLRDDYELIPIYSYDELHDKFGGKKTGYRGTSTWCHTNGKGTYDSNAWTNNGKNMFFVLAKKGWENTKPNKTDNAYDDYGTSLIAILVDVSTTDLKAETLRWNHVIEPSHTNSGASVDHAFKDNWGDLSQLVGFNVKEECEKYCKSLKEKLEKDIANANIEVEKILKTVDAIDNNTIPNKLRNYIKKITIPNSVTIIGEYAFYDCKSLTSITIPNSVTIIGDEAFSYCESLTSITIPNGVINIGCCAFSFCKSLISITIPNNVTSIGDNVFSRCKSLTSITIPNSVTNIGNNVFFSCESLTSITIPNSVTSIGKYAFYDCKSLTSITIPNSVTNIGNGAFSFCKSLKEITIPNSVTRISNWAFELCKSLTTITIPDSVTHIGAGAFSGCESLTSITIPDSLISIDDGAFDKCESLNQVVFSSNSPLLNNIKNGEFRVWSLKKEQIFIKKA